MGWAYAHTWCARSVQARIKADQERRKARITRISRIARIKPT
jgi:hypothetical protein